MILNPDREAEAKLLDRVLKGGVVQVSFGKDPRMHAGRAYALQTGGGKKAICEVECLEIWEEGGGWQAKVRLSKLDRPRFMAGRSELGYVHDHHRALDPDAEVVPEQWLNDHLGVSQEHTKLTKAQEVERRLLACRTFEERLVTLRNLARTHRVDVRSEFRLIDQLRRDGKLSRVERLATKVEDRVRREAA